MKNLLLKLKRKPIPKVGRTKKTSTPKKVGRPLGSVKNKEELDFIREKYFNENIGYKKIALMLGKNEDIVRKQVAKMICATIA